MDWKLTIAGFLIGGLVGMTGMGGGSLMTPMLVLLFGFKPTIAIGTDILHGAIFKSFGAVRHRRLGTVHLRLTAWMLLGSAPLSLVGVAVADWMEGRYGDGVESVQAKVLGAALVLGGTGFLAKAFVLPKEPRPGAFWLQSRDRKLAVAIGLSGGFIVGLTSVGSGTFFGLMMLIVYPLAAATIVGTDIMHAAFLLWVAGAGHVYAGNVDFGAMGWLLIGSIPGVLLSSQLTVKLPDRALRVALATVLTLGGIKLLEVPQSNWIISFGFGAGATALIILAYQARSNRRVPLEAGGLNGHAVAPAPSRLARRWPERRKSRVSAP
ncbi:MAG: sulfite exporter TauE/SafE family protein [Gaiellaceae bacterium]